MAAADFYKVLPPPILTGEELGVPPAPVAPQQPVLGPQPGDQRKRKASTIGAILASMIGGPGAGTGITQGTLQGFRNQDIERERNEQQAQQQFQYQQQDYTRQLQMHQQAQAQRQNEYARAIQSVQQQASQFKSKDEYDRFVEFVAGQMQANGFRVNANTIRQQAPYVAPKAEALAQEALALYLKNPNNEKRFKDSPEQAYNDLIPFDRDGDGVPERVKLGDLASLAQMPFAMGPDGKAMFAEKGTTAELKAGVDEVFRELLIQAKGEGKDVESQTPEAAKLREKLMLEARQKVENIQPPKPPKEAGGLTPNQDAILSEKLAKRWSDANKAERELQRQFNLMQIGLRRFRQGDTNGGSQAVLVTFQRILDPNSVVRESEYARTASGQALLNRIIGFVEKLEAGGAGMRDAELAAMVETGRQMLNGMTSFASGERHRITAQAKRFEIPLEVIFDDVLFDDAAGVDAGAPADTAAEPTPEVKPSWQRKLETR